MLLSGIPASESEWGHERGRELSDANRPLSFLSLLTVDDFYTSCFGHFEFIDDTFTFLAVCTTIAQSRFSCLPFFLPFCHFLLGFRSLVRSEYSGTGKTTPRPNVIVSVSPREILYHPLSCMIKGNQPPTDILRCSLCVIHNGCRVGTTHCQLGKAQKNCVEVWRNAC